MRACEGVRMGVKSLGAALTFLTLSQVAYSQATASRSLPALLWGSGHYFVDQSKDQGPRAVYESATATFLTRDLLGDSAGNKVASQHLNSSALAVDASQLVKVYALGQLKRSDLTHGSSDTLGLLKSAVQTAPSSLYLQNVAATHLQLAEAVQQTEGSVLSVGACASDSISLQQLEQRLGSQAGPLSVLVCDNQGSATSMAVEGLLHKSGQPYVFIYIGQADVEESRSVMRSLLASTAAQADKKVCDGKCTTQVRLFETIILLIIVLTALWIGMKMMHILHTPTRFEQEKKEQHRHQD